MQGVDARAAEMEWFNDAKLGIFIHWGSYSMGRWISTRAAAMR